MNKKEYVDKQIDYPRLLEDYGQYLNIIAQNKPLSAIFDQENASEDEFLMELVNYNFLGLGADEDKYFKECLWKVVEQNLKKLQAKLNEEYKMCEDVDRRVEIARHLGKLAQQLKNKSLEEFNVRSSR